MIISNVTFSGSNPRSRRAAATVDCAIADMTAWYGVTCCASEGPSNFFFRGRYHMVRHALPYREKVEVYVRKGSQVLAQDRGSYIMFPGGGIDPGENKAKAARREVFEETGATIRGIKHITTVDWDWFPEWVGNSANRKERYAQFRGERVHFLIADLHTAPTAGKHDDAWQGKLTMSIAKTIDLQRRYAERDHPNTKAYRVAQELVLKMLKMC